jgi:hypothetical protein
MTIYVGLASIIIGLGLTGFGIYCVLLSSAGMRLF